MAGIQMPDMPQGPRRTLLEELHGLYRRALIPPTRAISEVINKNDQLEATLSHETVAKALRGEINAGPTLRSLAWGLAELAGVDHEATVQRVDQLLQRAAQDISALPPEQALRQLEQLDIDELYAVLSKQPEHVREPILAALPPEKQAGYELMFAEAKKGLQALAQALTAMPPEQAAEILGQQDSGKILSILSFMDDEARTRVLSTMGVVETAKFMSREMISMAERNPDQVMDLRDGDLWVFGLGLVLLESSESERLRRILGPERAARAITEAVSHIASGDPEPDSDPDSVPGPENSPLVPDRVWDLWDQLAEYLSVNLGALAKDRDLQLWSDEDQPSALRLTTPFGQADFVCVDHDSGAIVVVKLCRDLPAEALFGQVTGLIGYVTRHLAVPGQRVEAIVVTDAMNEQLGYLSAALPDVRLMEYRLEFSLTEV